MDDFDKLFESTPLDKIVDVLQNAPRGAIENVIRDLAKEHLACKILLENRGVEQLNIDEFVFLNDAMLETNTNDFYIDITAKILGHEG